MQWERKLTAALTALLVKASLPLCVFYYYCFYYYCCCSKVGFAIRRLLFAERLEDPHLLLERCSISFSNVPKKLKTAEFAADDNLGEQLAEIVGSADCAFAASGSPTWDGRQHMLLAIWRRRGVFLVKSKTSQAEVWERQRRRLQHNKAVAGGEGQIWGGRSPMRGVEQTNKRLKSHSLRADWQVWALLTTQVSSAYMSPD